MKMKQHDSVKTNLILTMIYKSMIYVCWFLFGLSFKIFLNDKITDTRVFLLILSILLIYLARNFFKYLYRNIAAKNYKDIRIYLEQSAYQRINKLSFDFIENNNMNEIEQKCSQVIFRYMKFIYDLGEYLIPSIIGLTMVFIMLVRMNIFVALIIVGCFGGVLYYRFTHVDEEQLNDVFEHGLFSDMINKTFTIKLLNLKDYFVNKLKDDQDNSWIKLHNDDMVIDIKFTNGLLVILGLMLIAVFICVKGPLIKLGYIIFYIFMSFKLQKLLAVSTMGIINAMRFNKERIELDTILSNVNERTCLDDWSKITVKDGLVVYKSGVEIKIPNFALDKDDTVSIMGKSGQGKSTILRVLSGINSLSKGELLVDDESKNAFVDLVSVSKNISFFYMNVRDNLKLYTDITDEEILTLFKEANLMEWFNSLPDGLNSILPSNLSDDVLIKLAIIRGIILNKEVYFLDFGSFECDVEDDKVLTNMIKKHLKKKTYVIITGSALLNNLCKKHYFIKDHTLLESEPLL